MAPARRKGSGRAAAAAAAQQQWKVGDLVLAKMKGFPAWPATISEPEKWGFSATRKKVLVYFYGTQQIAFCNHVDIEAFTEEKKKILLNKRHGKGADFVRAVNEIITVYDKLKNKTQDELDSERSSRASPESDSHKVECHQFEALHASTEGSIVLASDDIVPASSEADLCTKSTEKKDPTENISMMDQLRQNPACSTASRKRLKDASLHSCGIQGKLTSQTSSEIAPCKVNKSNLPRTNENRQNVGGLMVDVGQIDVPAESNCQMPYTSGCHGLTLHVSEDFVSSERNDVVESNAVASWSEAANVNKCFMPEPSQTADQTGALKKDCLLDGELTHSVDFVTFKKKSKINRKVSSNADNGKVVVSLAGHKEDQLKQWVCSNGMVERSESTDGDEHLPLVKRARVRMKLQSEEEHLEEIANNNVKAGEGASTKGCSEQAICSGRLDGCPSNAADSTVRESSSCISNSNNCMPHDDVRFWKAKRYKLSGCNLDVEAALPPSKRLHRALEAMSANENANETLEECIQRPTVVDLIPNGSIDSPMPSTSIVSADEVKKVKVRNTMVACELRYNSSPSNDALVASAMLRELDMTVEKTIEGRSHTLSGKSSNICNQPCNVFMSEMSSTGTGCDNQPLQTSSTCAVEAEFCPSPSQDGEDKCSSAILQSNKSVGSPKDEKLVQSIPNADIKVAPTVTDFGLPVTNEGLISRSTMISSFEADKIAVSADMQEVVNDAKLKIIPKDSGFAIDMTPMKVLIAAAQAKRLLCRSTSFGDAATDVKVVPCASSSPCLHDKEYSMRGLSASSTINHRPKSDDRIHVLHNGRASPQSSSTQETNLKRSVSLDETNAARKSFEAILCTLSRTKDSIGRATRLAIECAKFGIATEVVEILLQHLERETEMHRRVDLFFLVDSITQCSANQKGDAGDVYPSLVQPILPRLLSAVAPPGHSARENRRQCLKVLKIWLERKILPESIIRAHMKELDAFLDVLPRRLQRNERALNDPVREMEGMLVDEYGSNTSFQLPGLLSPCVLEVDEEENACQEKASKASEPASIYEVNHERVPIGTPKNAKYPHVLEEVDGELEMEDVAPPCEIELSSKNHTSDAGSCTLSIQFDGQAATFAPPLPEDKPPSPPPLPCSPPPEFPASVPSHSPSMSHLILDATADSQLSNANNCHPKNKHAPDTNPNMAVPYYAPVCGTLAQQIPPPPPIFSSSDNCNGNVSVIHQSVHSGDNIQHPVTGTPNRLGYHLQPPPLTVSNQFSYVQGEAQHRGASWETHSSYTDFHFTNDRQVGNFYSEGIRPAAVRHDLPERSGFSSCARHGPSPSGHVETTMPRPYGQFLEPPSLPCRGWSQPPRISNYNQLPARPPFDPLARPAGAPGYWRPR